MARALGTLLVIFSTLAVLASADCGDCDNSPPTQCSYKAVAVRIWDNSFYANNTWMSLQPLSSNKNESGMNWSINLIKPLTASSLTLDMKVWRRVNKCWSLVVEEKGVYFCNTQNPQVLAYSTLFRFRAGGFLSCPFQGPYAVKNSRPSSSELSPLLYKGDETLVEMVFKNNGKPLADFMLISVCV